MIPAWYVAAYPALFRGAKAGDRGGGGGGDREDDLPLLADGSAADVDAADPRRRGRRGGALQAAALAASFAAVWVAGAEFFPWNAFRAVRRAARGRSDFTST